MQLTQQEQTIYKTTNIEQHQTKQNKLLQKCYNKTNHK